jgi:hypothetical protein
MYYMYMIQMVAFCELSSLLAGYVTSRFMGWLLVAVLLTQHLMHAF